MTHQADTSCKGGQSPWIPPLYLLLLGANAVSKQRLCTNRKTSPENLNIKEISQPKCKTQTGTIRPTLMPGRPEQWIPPPLSTTALGFANAVSKQRLWDQPQEILPENLNYKRLDINNHNCKTQNRDTIRPTTHAREARAVDPNPLSTTALGANAVSKQRALYQPQENSPRKSKL
ncbi:hypothetical protein HNY73_004187 [Argiope bruennichi]|uniref:Uncharacterized protein n=1 Tax=Argiope bruennichi TaxID=94029 RepID=A0A8T0FV19_ARGBR|nr:hypothetical protein HNY73_004187 [Argiope bruennichi]